MRSLSTPSHLRWLRWFIPALGLVVAGALVVGAAGVWAYEHDSRVRFRVQEFWGSVRTAVEGPQPEFAPTAVGVLAAVPTFAASSTPPPTATLIPSATPEISSTPAPSATPSATPSPSPSPTPLPPQATLTGFKHEYQLFNNCGPASLAMDLSYWGWAGDQKQAAAVLKPNQDDKNVSPREVYEYALSQGYDAYIRMNGDVETLKRFIAAGYPVMVEKGFNCVEGERCTGWFGHYSVFSGYDDAKQIFTMQDSFKGPNLKMTYAEVLENWRAFNYLYIVLFPANADNDAQVQQLLGPALDVEQNYRDALARAQAEAQASTGQAAAFAWFNVGTSLYYLQDYSGAAAAFDQARAIGLPYRMLWYQFGPFHAYYALQRYQDVVDLTSFAIKSVNTVPGLEESYYYRGLAELALGDRTAAEEDFRTAMQRHPNYAPAAQALRDMGLMP